MSSVNGIEIGEIPTGRFVASGGWENFGIILLFVLGLGIGIILLVALFGKRKAEIIESDLKPPIFPPGGPF